MDVLNYDTSIILHVCLQFRWQKKRDHSIHRWLPMNETKQYLCSVCKYISIIQRFIWLGGLNIQNEPLAVYRNKKRPSMKYHSQHSQYFNEKSSCWKIQIDQERKHSTFSCHSLIAGTFPQITLPMSKNTYAQSVNRLVLYKDLLDYEVQRFEINLLQFTEIKKDKWETS